MKKILMPAIILSCFVFVGASCSRLDFLSGKSGSAPATKTTKEKVDYCQKIISDAEAAIAKQEIKTEAKKPFDVWKQLFMKTNGIDEGFFNKYIFASASLRKSTVNEDTYGIGYYYKVGDIYLESSGEVIITKEKLDYFNSTPTEDLLVGLLPPKSKGFNEPHPDFGNVPKIGINNFDWGTVTVDKVKLADDDKTPPNVVCQELVSLLKTCRSDIEAGGILGLVYKPALGRAWLDGYSANYFDMDMRGKNKCAYAEVTVFDKKVTCHSPITCTGGITP